MRKHIKKILVFDDKTEFANAIKKHLSRNGFLIHLVHTFKAAQKMIREAEEENVLFDLVIADISLPESSGIVLLQWIQKKHSHTSIMLISGFGTNDLISKNMRPLVDDFCKKPFSPQTLLSKIESIEEGRRSCYEKTK